MNEIKIILNEQFKNFNIIRRVSKYEEKATYQNHYLGMIWQFLNPMIQIGIYYLVFGVGLNGGRKVDGYPFIVWMLIGITAWFFINSTILGGSNSIFKKVGLVSKMKFPMSILPSITIFSNLVSYAAMMVILLLTMFIYGIYPTIYWIQYFYYFFCMITFLFSFSLLNSTITVLIRDYHIALQSVIRVLFYLSGVIWDVETRNFPIWFVRILKLNPIYYIVDGFRDSFLSKEWFWNKGAITLFFWILTFSILIIGSHLHIKFRSRFVDFI